KKQYTMTHGTLWIPLCTLCVLLLVTGVQSDDELIMSNLLYRHGARSPQFIYPTDPHKDHWKDGVGRLTQKGMKMEYDLGKFLKTRYVDTKFVSQHYLHTQVTIRSSGVDRCLQSAEAQLAALYPPSDWQIWGDEELGKLWQPIPIQTVPDDEDPVLRPESTKNCPRYPQLIAEMKSNSDEYQKKIKESQELLKYMSLHSGTKVTMDNMWMIYDNFKSGTEEGLEQPKWILDRLDEMRSLSWYLFRFKYQGQKDTADLLGRLTGGSLLGIMNDNMKLWTSGAQDEKKDLHKLNIFSAHDSTLLSLSAALQTDIIDEIPFSASILVELFNSSGNYYVKMTYKHKDTLTPWKLSDCDEKCPLDDFISKTKNRVPEDRDKDCQTESEFFSHKLIIFTCVRTRHRKKMAEKMAAS
uniref:acid phosphatase n=1 Tax=Clytia hemisphaerica TaxID=252671 RepID=A0A7M5UZU2_9CNID